jgi:predicted DNA-binding mobile mystery protein A
MSDRDFLPRLQAWVHLNQSALFEILGRNDWVKSMRRAQGLRGRDLAEHMSVSPARVSILERAEQEGAVTLKMMKKAASAMDCEFVYLLVPKSSVPSKRASDKAVYAKPRLKVTP